MAAAFPIPVTPPPPLSAHSIEVERARIAEEAARHAPAVLQSTILYEDKWIVAVNKPAGRYCEDVLAGVVGLLASPGGCSHHTGSESVKAVENAGGRFDSNWAGRGGSQLAEGAVASATDQLLADTIQRQKNAEVLVGSSGVSGDVFGDRENVGGAAPQCGGAEVPATRVHIRPHEAKLAKQSRREAGVAGGGNEAQAKEALAYMVHRLDRDTSGVQIVAKSKHAAAAFMKLFADRQVQKTYLALGFGTPPEQREFTLRTGHGRSRHGMFRVYGEEDVGRSLPGGKSARVQSMETRFEVIGTFAPGETHGDRTFETVGIQDGTLRDTVGIQDRTFQECVNGVDRSLGEEDGVGLCEAGDSEGGLSEGVKRSEEVTQGGFGEVGLDVREVGRGCAEANCSGNWVETANDERSELGHCENGRLSTGSPLGKRMNMNSERHGSSLNDDVHERCWDTKLATVGSGLGRQNGPCKEQPSAGQSEISHELPDIAIPLSLGRETMGDRFVLMRCHPLTGRTHQIRLHCLFLGLPLVGDARYGGLLEIGGKEQAAHCLHAESLALKHPFLGTHLSITAPDPTWASAAT